MHFDTYLGQDLRRVTAIVYLNSAWQPSDGGQLRICPWPHAQADIEPVMNRVVRPQPY